MRCLTNSLFKKKNSFQLTEANYVNLHQTQPRLCVKCCVVVRMGEYSTLPLLYSGTHQAAILLHCSFSGLQQNEAAGSAAAAAVVAAAKTERARSRDRRLPGPPHTDAHRNIRGHLHACQLTQQPALRLLPEALGEEKLQLHPPKKKVPAEASRGTASRFSMQPALPGRA